MARKRSNIEAVRATIFDLLYSGKTGLPEAYTEQEITAKSEDVFRHSLLAIPNNPITAALRQRMPTRDSNDIPDWLKRV